MRKFALAAAAAMTLAAPVALAQEGTYTLAGVSQDKTTYTGSVEVKKIGAGFQILWDLGGEKVYGAGLQDGPNLIIGTVYDKKSIVAVMKPEGANWKGQWYQRAEQGLGEETWTKR